MNPPSVSTRVFFLDWLRIAAFALLILFHVGMYYVHWDWHIKSPSATGALAPFMMLSSPWRLSLLFLVSGAATSMMLLRGPSGGLLGTRTKRLLLPLVCGMVLVVPPQPYFEVVQKAGYGGGYLDFLQLYFTGYGGFCKGSECLVLPTWNHLWFVPYLWLYTVLLWALCRLRPNALATLAHHAGRVLAGSRIVWLPILVLALMRIALVGRFPSTHALIDDWFNHALFFSMFATGAVFARMPGLWDRLPPLRWLALGVAVAGWVALVSYYGNYDTNVPPPDWLRQCQRVVYAAVQWCALIAAFGFARHHLSFDHTWRRYLTDAVFPVYILHQTLIILVAVALRPLDLTAGIEAPLLIAATFVLSFAGYEAVRRIRVLRPWFGLPSASAPQQFHGASASAASP